MIFFREHRVPLHLRKGKSVFTLYAGLKVFFSAPVDSQSGMTVNLRDVDQWFKEIQTNTGNFSTMSEACRFYHRRFSEKSSSYLRLELRASQALYIYDGEKFFYDYSLSTWFRQDQGWSLKPLRLRSVAPLSKAWLERLKKKRWSGTTGLFQACKKLSSSLKEVTILHEEQEVWEKIQL